MVHAMLRPFRRPLSLDRVLLEGRLLQGQSVSRPHCRRELAVPARRVDEHVGPWGGTRLGLRDVADAGREYAGTSRTADHRPSSSWSSWSSSSNSSSSGSQVQSSGLSSQPLQTPSSMGAPHALQGVHPHESHIQLQPPQNLCDFRFTGPTKGPFFRDRFILCWFSPGSNTVCARQPCIAFCPHEWWGRRPAMDEGDCQAYRLSAKRMILSRRDS